MKYLKLSFVAVLMTFMIMSCSDDIVNEDGIGGTDNLPDTKITVVTEVDGEVVNTTEVTKTKDDVTYKPDGYSVNGSFTGTSKMLTIYVNNAGTGSNTFGVNMVFNAEKVSEGTYTLNSNISSYINKDIAGTTYTGVSGTLNLTKVQEISSNGVGSYYCEGNIEIAYMNTVDAPSTLTVKTDFVGVPVSFNSSF